MHTAGRLPYLNPGLRLERHSCPGEKEISEDHTSLLAAGVSFFAFVAFIPGLGAATRS